jgi:hypothetical protein
MRSCPPAEPDLERIRLLARALADSDPGPAAELGCALADAVTALAGRIDELWRIIVAVVEAAAGDSAEAGPGDASGPPAEFLRALSAPRGTGHRGVLLSIGGTEWAAALSRERPPADPARAWAALERVARAADDQEPDR